jgi:hypothetical protein
VHGSHRLPVILVLAALAVTIAGSASGQAESPTTGSIHGRVLLDGRPAGFALVVVLGTRRGAQTDEAGNFRVTLVPPGRWQVKVIGLGTRPSTAAASVTAGGDTPLEISVGEEPQVRMRRHPLPDCDSTRDAHVSERAASPDTAGWWTASGSNFDFSLPTEFRKRHTQGIDSEVGEWDADSTQITYDMGMYTGCAQPGDPEPGSRAECLGGFHAQIRSWPDDGRLGVEACFPALGLALFGRTHGARERDRILVAFRSIRFHDAGGPRLLTGPPVPVLPPVARKGP